MDVVSQVLFRPLGGSSGLVWLRQKNSTSSVMQRAEISVKRLREHKKLNWKTELLLYDVFAVITCTLNSMSHEISRL